VPQTSRDADRAAGRDRRAYHRRVGQESATGDESHAHSDRRMGRMRLIPNSRRGALWRFTAAAMIVVACAAATTAVAGLLQIKQIVQDLNLTPALKHVPVVLPPAGAPQTILVIGSDHRAGDPYASANTDTMMLIRLDASSSTINLLSVPRDLEVQLPTGGGQTGNFKLNAAYSLGGVKLLINTLKQQVFPGIQINHVLDVNFGAFIGLVNAIGCVYAAVDHRYYNSTALTNYSSIDVRPGYQKLCGTQALQFVRFRHTDSDIVRNARQQDFIRWAKDQYSVGQLLSNRDMLLKIFGKNVQTDHGLHTSDGLINLFSLGLNSDLHQIKQIPFPAQFGVCNAGPTGTAAAQTPCYVTASPVDELRAFNTFMTPTAPAPGASAAGPVHPHRKTTPGSTGLVADPADGHTEALALGPMPFPVYYPKLIYGGAYSAYCSSVTGNCDDPAEPASEYAGEYPRAYEIHGQRGGSYPSYVMTLVVNAALGEYYTIQGTTWMHPPILNGISGTRTVGGKVLDLYQNGAHLSVVAWRASGGVYWISNTLTDSLTNNQMIGIAASLTRAR
jgi:LCP family protein required for cell wall assembly